MEEKLLDELLNIKSNYEINNILYYYYRICNDKNEYKKVLNNIDQKLTNILKNIYCYINNNKDDDNKYITNSIIGKGVIKIEKEDKKIKIELDTK